MDAIDIRSPMLRRIADSAADIVFPPSCLLCDRLLPAGSSPGVCAECRSLLTPAHPPYCRVCGRSFTAGEESRPCSNCRLDPPEFDMLRAPFHYTGPLRDAIIRFKFHRRTRHARALANMLALTANMGIRWDSYDLVTPVPLHPSRLVDRGFNQSLVLARLAGGGGAKPRFDVLERVRPTVPQTGLSGAQRKENVRGAFALAPGASVAGKKVLLVDDVVTTGATIRACAKALKKAGAVRVDVAAVARAGAND